MTTFKTAPKVESAIQEILEEIKQQNKNLHRKNYIKYLRNEFDDFIKKTSIKYGISENHLRNVGGWQNMSNIINNMKFFKEI